VLFATEQLNVIAEIGTLEIVSLDGEELSIGTMKTGARDVATLVAAGKTVIAVPR
jgi:hypothetical protein